VVVIVLGGRQFHADDPAAAVVLHSIDAVAECAVVVGRITAVWACVHLSSLPRPKDG